MDTKQRLNYLYNNYLSDSEYSDSEIEDEFMELAVELLGDIHWRWTYSDIIDAVNSDFKGDCSVSY